MPAPRTAAAAIALLLAVPATAHAEDHPAPVVHCYDSHVNKFSPFGGVAYTTSNPLPRRLTIICSVDNGYDRTVTRETAEGPAVAVAAVATRSHPDVPELCATAIAEYADGTSVTTSHCGRESPV
jgi:hypothetical protein